jgi:hypothetical protein
MLSYFLPVGPVVLALSLLASVLAVHYVVRAGLGLIQQSRLRAVALCLAILLSSTVMVHKVLYPDLPLISLAWPSNVVRWLREANAQGLTVPREGFVFLLAVFLWWRGLALAQRRTTSLDVAYSFRIGVLIVSVTAALGSLVLAWPVQYVVFAYFFVGLIGIAFARADESNRRRTDGRSVATFGWCTGIVLAGFGVIVLAAAVASVLTGDNLTLIVRPLAAALRAALVAIVFVAGLLAEVVGRVMGLFLNDVNLDRLREALTSLHNLRVPEIEATPSRWSAGQLASLRTIVILGGGSLLVVALALSVRWLRRRFDKRQGGDTESVWEGVNARRAAGRLARRAQGWLADRAGRVESRVSRYFAAMTIRRIYGRVLALAGARGYPRLADQTPYEFLPVLSHALPGMADPLAQITEAYVAVHYGQYPEEPAVLAAVITAWEAIRNSAAEESGSDRPVRARAIRGGLDDVAGDHNRDPDKSSASMDG